MPDSKTLDDLKARIEELEAKAAENALIADLATEPETRDYNAHLAQELRALASQLRRVQNLQEQDLQPPARAAG